MCTPLSDRKLLNLNQRTTRRLAGSIGFERKEKKNTKKKKTDETKAKNNSEWKETSGRTSVRKIGYVRTDVYAVVFYNSQHVLVANL